VDRRKFIVVSGRQILHLGASSSILAAMIACDDKHGSVNPAGSSPVTTPQQPTVAQTDFRTQSFMKVGRFSSENKFYAQFWGNLNLLQDLKDLNGGDWNGTTFYLREYVDNGNRRVSYIVQYANSTPLGNTNVTLIRDIESDGKVDFDLLIAPKDGSGKELSRITVTFANKGNPDRFKMEPTNLSINNDSRVQGPLPVVATLQQLQGIRSSGGSLDEPVLDLANVPPAKIYSIETRQPDGSYR
jgi:hypothetical protein